MSIERKTYSLDIAGKTLKVEMGRFANLANASAMITYEETSVLTVATDSGKRSTMGFFPLSVNYEEKMYAAGKIPGGYLKREGRPSENATLISRVIDRSIRPLFPDGFSNEVQIVATVMSVDRKVPADMLAMLGASIALSVSDIPFEKPIAGVKIGYVNNEFVVNPSEEVLEESTMDLVVAGTKDAVVMVEAGAKMVPDSIMLEAILFAHEEIKKIVAFVEMIVAEIGVEKRDVIKEEIDEEFYNKVFDEMTDDVDKAMRIADKHERNDFISEVKENMKSKYKEILEENEGNSKLIGKAVDALQKKTVRKMIIEEKIRPDGRAFDEIRPLSSDVNILPRVHGTGLFQRGVTQALSIVTLGAAGDAQRLDGLEATKTKRYMHQYNFPPYSVGETGRMFVNRRAIGHGALGERALVPVLPSVEEFPYAIRVVSEVLTCNGSSSQASICGSTLALLDAGVPIKDSVAGIAMGLIKEGDKLQVLTDIQGIEDFYGNMDFKVAGTREGITALQMDIKMDGLSKELLEEALNAGKKARNQVLDNMAIAITAPREELSKYAPRIFSIKIDPEKIGKVIGPGGKTITRITAEYDVKIDIDDDGMVLITANDKETGEGALSEIEMIVKEAKVGEIYIGTIKKILNFGAFVELFPGSEGLCHISQFTQKRLKNIEDSFKVGDEIFVKVIKIDEKGRVDLSRKEALKDKDMEDDK
ncbi:polyribonucleotide nucleotidyltransferase [Clostridiaceae bacterium HSG29]|nr:polyribonucleotide nucleotidyltransferase [Clostridiaceae bacterium HSG29]